MKTATVLQFTDLAALCKYIKIIHASTYRVDTTKLTLKLPLTSFEISVAVEQFDAVVVEQLERV